MELPTSHCKGPSDGVGGTVKREARKESLRHPYDKQIMTAKDLFSFAESGLKGIKFDYGTQTMKTRNKSFNQEWNQQKQLPGLNALFPSQQMQWKSVISVPATNHEMKMSPNVRRHSLEI